MQTTIVKWGNSRGVRLPKILLDSACLSDNDAVEVTVEDNSIVIKKAVDKAFHKSIRERFEGFSGEYEPTSIDWGSPVGNEIW